MSRLDWLKALHTGKPTILRDSTSQDWMLHLNTIIPTQACHNHREDRSQRRHVLMELSNSHPHENSEAESGESEVACQTESVTVASVVHEEADVAMVDLSI